VIIEKKILFMVYSLRDYIQDGDYDDFDELKKELKKFKEKK